MSGVIPKETLASINEALSEQMGLRFPENRLRDLERGLLVACRELGLGGADHCLDALRGEKFSREQVELLASHLTIGETYFFREPKSYDALREKILPELIERRRHSTRLIRIWSAGCSSGEEAYSLAILLQRLIPDWQDWGITILGTDINPEALHKAEQGVYGEWSFRGLGSDFKEKYFTKVEKKRYRINDEVRRFVRFSYLNLAEQSSYPSLATNTLAMDIIFCRNVLMYFSRETIYQVTRRFFDSLTDRGWILTSPSEASSQYFPGFQTVNFPGAIFFRKPEAGAAAIPAGPKAETAPSRFQWREEWRKRAAVSRVRPSATGEATRGRLSGRRPDLTELGLIAKASANRGDLPEALACCKRALANDPLAVRFHYLKAGVLQEMGESDRAADALRKALFLERNFAMAHFTLASLYRQCGKRPEARRHFRLAEELLSQMPPDQSPPEAEGMNAARLCEMAAANLRSLN